MVVQWECSDASPHIYLVACDALGDDVTFVALNKIHLSTLRNNEIGLNFKRSAIFITKLKRYVDNTTKWNWNEHKNKDYLLYSSNQRDKLRLNDEISSLIFDSIAIPVDGYMYLCYSLSISLSFSTTSCVFICFEAIISRTWVRLHRIMTIFKQPFIITFNCKSILACLQMFVTRTFCHIFARIFGNEKTFRRNSRTWEISLQKSLKCV